MESGKNKVTTKEQFEKLIEIMRKHPETGRGKPQFGCTKNKTKGLWEDCAKQLNSLGPPIRTAKEWGRVWVHYKGNLKRRLGNNRANQIATGGGPSQEQSLNALEESVVELIQIRTQVAPSGHAFGTTNIPPASEEINNSVDAADAASMPPETNVPNEDDRPTTSGRTQNPRRTKSVETKRLELLITQTETQKEVVTKLGKLEKAVKKNMELIKNVETERIEQLTIQTEMQKEVAKKLGKLEKALNKNIELNEKMLEIKQKKYALYEKQMQEASELHTLKVEVEKLKISKLQGHLPK